MAVRSRLAVAALLVLVIGIPMVYATLWAEQRSLTWHQLYLFVAVPPLVALTLAATSVIPSRTRPHSNRCDWLGITVGSMSVWVLVIGLGLVAVATVV
jgi:hypothetical protein